MIGHSAGAHGALWTSARTHRTAKDESGVDEPLRVESVFALDGPVDLAAWIGPDVEACGKPVIVPFMGGAPADRPERCARGSPDRLLPVDARQFLIAAELLKPPEALAYARRAAEKGNHVQVLVLDAGHFEVIAPGRDEWASIEGLILANTVLRASGRQTSGLPRQEKTQSATPQETEMPSRR